MNKSLLLLLVVVGVALAADTDPVILEGILRDQSDHRMAECGYNGACCGSAGQANGTYGWVGTDFQLPLSFYQNNEKGLVGGECNVTTGYKNCGRIGADRTPVYAYTGQSPGKNIQSPKTFYNWFHNSEQTRNVPFNLTLPYKGSGLYEYKNFTFFPLDGLGWNDKCNDSNKNPHNYGYCWETHFRFGYTGGEQFDFTGDDDVWAYINDILVIDLGSLHQKLQKSIKLDDVAPYIGISKASNQNPDASYIFDFFYCERHTTESNMQITTSLAGYCAYDDWCGVCEGNGLSCCTQDVINQYCDDKNACTFDTCVPQVNPKLDPIRGCKHVPLVNCSSNDICKPSTCNAKSGQCEINALNCDDNDPCTTDTCVSSSGCVHTRQTCDDKNVCTDDSCNAQGNCVNTPKPPCDDKSKCTIDTCDPVRSCIFTPISCPVSVCFPYQCTAANGCTNSTLSCDDKTVCTIDACVESSGGCTHTPINCDDQNACTKDSCDPINSCQHLDITPTCNDSNVCTNDGCDKANGCYNQPVICPKKNCYIESCVSPSTGCVYTPKPCDDNNACTSDTCDSVSGQCVFQNIDCKAGNDCRASSCDKKLGCLNTTIDCDDHNLCTDDFCLAKGGCQHVDNSARCNDNNACTNDTCDPVKNCINTDISASCNDGDPCTIDTCIKATGCQVTPKDCNTNAPACKTGACGADGSCVYTDIPNCSKCLTPVVIECKANVTNKCLPWRCDPNTVQCVRDPDVVCNDSNNCTLDSCIPGTGLCNFTQKNCDDNDPCTDDTCDRVKGCINTPKTCDDKNVCTKDSCVAGKCQFTNFLTCNDGNACTDDVCLPATGCQYTNKTCNDNNPCTTDSCGADGLCVFAAISGQCLPCGNATRCTWSDSCFPQTCDNTTNTCKTVPVTACNDFSACTNDTCIGSGATYTCNYATIPCNPIDPCHTALCDPVNGCVQKIITCDDSNPCTTDSCLVVGGKGVCSNVLQNCTFADQCAPQKCNTTTGLCQAYPKTCTDGNLCTIDTCDKSTGGCIFTPVVCSTDPCKPAICNFTNGLCDAVLTNCDDGNTCTTDTAYCDPLSALGPQCKHTINTTRCDDGLSCTNDYCNSSVPIGQNPCQFTPVVCDQPDACTDNITCVEGKGCYAIPKACALNDTSDNTTDWCTIHKCDKNAGCIYLNKTCPNDDSLCFNAFCDPVEHCVMRRRSDFGSSSGKGGVLCALLYDDTAKKAAITAGALAGIIIGSVAAAALIGAGGKAGYDFLMAKNSPMGPVATNPLYAQSAASGNNQLYAG